MGALIHLAVVAPDADQGAAAIAATFAAMLELAKRGELEIRQERAFGDIALRRRRAEA